MNFEWFTTTDSKIWFYIDRVSVLLSYVVVFSIGSAFYYFMRFLRRYRRLKNAMRVIDGSSKNPKAFAVCFGGSIKKAVEDYLKAKYQYPIPLTEYAVTSEVTPHNIQKHIEQLSKIKNDFQSHGVTELHLFVKGPVIMGTVLGAIFDNWVTVKLYHNNRSGEYEEWTVLHSAKTLTLEERLEYKVADLIEGGKQGVRENNN
ncbi:MAG: hypothetical protein AB1480_09725 [Nitrospirota bacterium]